ncbi:MAG: hypothetical protein ACPHCM_05335 [Arenicellales bacterium]
MTDSLILLSITYAFVLFVMLLILTRSRYPLGLRFAVIALAAGVYVTHFFALDALRGWPTTTALPKQFALKAWAITEPNPSAETAGRIDLWIQTDDSDMPRAYSVTYSQALHQQLESAGERMKQGYRQQGATRGTGSIEFSDTQRRLPLKSGSG